MQRSKAPTLEHPIRLKLTAKPQLARMIPLPLSQPLPQPQDLASSKISFQRKEQDLLQSSMWGPIELLMGHPKPKIPAERDGEEQEMWQVPQVLVPVIASSREVTASEEEPCTE